MSLCKHTLLLSLFAFAPVAIAQEPTPSPELKKLQPLVGSWKGSGTMTEPGNTTKWTATGSYRWVLGNFWLREDFDIRFEGMPDPLVFRVYMGWDQENKKFVSVSVSNTGEVQLHDVEIQPDGSMLQMATQRSNGMSYAQRSVFKIDGNKMTHSIDLLLPQGPSMQMVDGTFERTETEATAVEPKTMFMGGTANPAMARFAKMVGAYGVQGEMVMAPGSPAVKITGTDTYSMTMGGAVLCNHTVGEAEGMPGKYECDSFHGWDEQRGCVVCCMVSSVGEVGLMEESWTPEGQMIGTMAGRYMGQPILSRAILSCDASGHPTAFNCHCLLGAAAPFENFKSTYTKQ